MNLGELLITLFMLSIVVEGLEFHALCCRKIWGVFISIWNLNVRFNDNLTCPKLSAALGVKCKRYVQYKSCLRETANLAPGDKNSSLEITI